MAKKQELMKPNEGETAVVLPTYIKESNEGREQIDQDDLRLPRLKVIQPLSAEAQEDDAVVKPGDLLVNPTGEVLQKGTKCSIIATRRLRNYWRDPGSGEGIVCHSPDGKSALNPNGITVEGSATNQCATCIRSKFTKEGERNIAPACTEYREFLLLLDDYPLPVVASMGKAAMKAARKLVQKLNADMGTRNVPIYAFQFELGVVSRVNNAGKKWWELELKPNGFVSEQLYQRGAEMYAINKDRLKTTAIGEAVVVEEGDAPAV